MRRIYFLFPQLGKKGGTGGLCDGWNDVIDGHIVGQRCSIKASAFGMALDGGLGEFVGLVHGSFVVSAHTKSLCDEGLNVA
jgi:hypothetical protein